jgi:hypothetical protein
MHCPKLGKENAGNGDGDSGFDDEWTSRARGRPVSTPLSVATQGPRQAVAGPVVNVAKLSETRGSSARRTAPETMVDERLRARLSGT